MPTYSSARSRTHSRQTLAQSRLGKHCNRHLRPVTEVIRPFADVGANEKIGAREAPLRHRIGAHQFIEFLIEALEQTVEQRIQQRVLGREMVQQTALADAGCAGDGIERNRRHALLRRKACGDIQQLPAHENRLFLAMMSS